LWESLALIAKLPPISSKWQITISTTPLNFSFPAMWLPLEQPRLLQAVVRYPEDGLLRLNRLEDDYRAVLSMRRRITKKVKL
jgi:hypothetical protein